MLPNYIYLLPSPYTYLSLSLSLFEEKRRRRRRERGSDQGFYEKSRVVSPVVSPDRTYNTEEAHPL